MAMVILVRWPTNWQHGYKSQEPCTVNKHVELVQCQLVSFSIPHIIIIIIIIIIFSSSSSSNHDPPPHSCKLSVTWIPTLYQNYLNRTTQFFTNHNDPPGRKPYPCSLRLFIWTSCGWHGKNKVFQSWVEGTIEIGCHLHYDLVFMGQNAHQDVKISGKFFNNVWDSCVLP